MPFVSPRTIVSCNAVKRIFLWGNEYSIKQWWWTKERWLLFNSSIEWMKQSGDEVFRIESVVCHWTPYDETIEGQHYLKGFVLTALACRALDLKRVIKEFVIFASFRSLRYAHLLSWTDPTWMIRINVSPNCRSKTDFLSSLIIISPSTTTL